MTTALQLLRYMGPRWIVFRAQYALKRRAGWLKRRTPCGTWDSARPYCFANYAVAQFTSSKDTAQLRHEADRILAGEICYFSRHWYPVGFPPPWVGNPFNEVAPNIPVTSHWSEIRDDGETDIKLIWEPSRFAFAFVLAEAFLATRDEQYAEGFWRAVENWRDQNPPQCGPNWMCGQEVAIRMIAWLYALQILEKATATTQTRRDMMAVLIGVSAERVDTNIGYALSQKNNHGISEATALFSAGVVLGEARWQKRGQRFLEQQTRELIYDDGSFAQHSVNYHRVVLDAYRWATGLAGANHIRFSRVFLHRVRKAKLWLRAMIDNTSGGAPNLGSNDGAHIFPVGSRDYLNYRNAVVWDLNGSDESAQDAVHDKEMRFFPDGGYAIFSHAHGKLIFRCPTRFRHRPAQCDILNIDLWNRGINILRDSGTYSYNTQPPWQHYFKSAAAHNTAVFDAHDQMPELGRFLYGRWPRCKVAESLSTSPPSVTAAYSDWKGCRHERTVILKENTFEIVDTLSGFTEQAVLRWHLAPALEWNLSGDTCTSQDCSIQFHAEDSEALRIAWGEGWESRHYMEKEAVPTLDVTLHRPGVVRTCICLSQQTVRN